MSSMNQCTVGLPRAASSVYRGMHWCSTEVAVCSGTIPNHGVEAGVLCQRTRGGPGLEVDIVRPGLGGQAGQGHVGLAVFEEEAVDHGLHQQSGPAVPRLEQESVGVRLSFRCSSLDEEAILDILQVCLLHLEGEVLLVASQQG